MDALIGAQDEPASRFGRLTVADVMDPGCVSVPADAPVRLAAAALEAHSVHAVLVTDPRSCRPLGWLTARGLVRADELAQRPNRVGDVIDERVTVIGRGRPVKTARYALSLQGVSRLLVRPNDGTAPEGVVTRRDIARAMLSGPVR